MEFDQYSIKNHKKKHKKITKNQQKSPPNRHLGPARAPGGPKSSKKRSDVKFSGGPGTPLGAQKSQKSQQNEVQKSMKKQKDSKEIYTDLGWPEPPKRDQK